MKKQNKHKHDWQLLSYGNKPVNMVVLIVCRECAKVLEQKVEYEKKQI